MSTRLKALAAASLLPLMLLAGCGDSDGDGLSNSDEKELGTNPDLADTDGDGINDFDEVNGVTIVQSVPLKPPPNQISWFPPASSCQTMCGSGKTASEQPLYVAADGYCESPGRSDTRISSVQFGK